LDTVAIFFSYAHEDEQLRDELSKHLRILERQGVISTWHDRKITAGSEWKGEIDTHLESAQTILLLISADFLASDYCYDVEMTRALERHKNNEAVVIPVILRPVSWSDAPFAKLQALPKDAKAVTEWPNQDAAFRNITEGIRDAIRMLATQSNQDITEYVSAKLDVAGGPFETILIPAGPFLMGSPDATGEWKQHTVSLDYVYEIGKYPVTNEQYAKFANEEPERRPKAGGWRFTQPPQDKLDHPVVGISWEDAVAYCQWLSQETRRTCRLPTEAEWEKAASWDEDTRRKRRYPWGDEFDPDRCNSEESGHNDTTAVGTYSPPGDSSFGCGDMAGNVWEWTSTLWRDNGLKAQFTYPFKDDGRDNTKQESTTFRIFRGGAYNSDIPELDCSSRDYYASDSHNKNLGYRVVLEG
jgi:formylglycine-generating enzyme required for sulfatase activity